MEKTGTDPNGTADAKHMLPEFSGQTPTSTPTPIHPLVLLLLLVSNLEFSI